MSGTGWAMGEPARTLPAPPRRPRATRANPAPPRRTPRRSGEPRAARANPAPGRWGAAITGVALGPRCAGKDASAVHLRRCGAADVAGPNHTRAAPANPTPLRRTPRHSGEPRATAANAAPPGANPALGRWGASITGVALGPRRAGKDAPAAHRRRCGAADVPGPNHTRAAPANPTPLRRTPRHFGEPRATPANPAPLRRTPRRPGEPSARSMGRFHHRGGARSEARGQGRSRGRRRCGAADGWHGPPPRAARANPAPFGEPRATRANPAPGRWGRCDHRGGARSEARRQSRSRGPPPARRPQPTGCQPITPRHPGETRARSMGRCDHRGGARSEARRTESLLRPGDQVPVRRGRRPSTVSVTGSACRGDACRHGVQPSRRASFHPQSVRADPRSGGCTDTRASDHTKG